MPQIRKRETIIALFIIGIALDCKTFIFLQNHKESGASVTIESETDERHSHVWFTMILTKHKLKRKKTVLQPSRALAQDNADAPCRKVKVLSD